MQDEVNEKTVSLCIRGGKITAQLLKAAMRKALAQMEQEKAPAIMAYLPPTVPQRWSWKSWLFSFRVL